MGGEVLLVPCSQEVSSEVGEGLQKSVRDGGWGSLRGVPFPGLGEGVSQRHF